jgi:glucose-6-phosphate isomerase
MGGDWAQIDEHAARLGQTRILDLFAADGRRVEDLTIAAPHMLLDISKQRIDAAAIAALAGHAGSMDFEDARRRLFDGGVLNETEGREVLHTNLRSPGPQAAEAAQVRGRVRDFARQFRERRIAGATGAPLDAIVHIGIGGSDLGPRLLADALKTYRTPGVTLRFAANVDGADIADALEGLDPARTLVVVVSKTFTTQETMANAEAARAWLKAALGPDAAQSHLAAVTAAPERAGAWGIAADRLFPIREWVGGRYSLWSAVGLSVDCALRDGAFDALLSGAAEMDAHFRTAPLPRNAPFASACVQMLARTHQGAHAYVVAPYARRLALLPAFLQQLEMESNGKGVDRDGKPVRALAAAVTFGDVGTNAQHSFFQLLHQGAEPIPVEFVVDMGPPEGPAHHRVLLRANVLAQAEALLLGKTEAAARADLFAAGADAGAAMRLAPHKAFPGDRPSTIIGLEAITPTAVGALLALYEHRTFAQAVMMGINAFDQWGVELGKVLAQGVARALEGKPAVRAHDPSTAAWIARLRE